MKLFTTDFNRAVTENSLEHMLAAWYNAAGSHVTWAFLRHKVGTTQAVTITDESSAAVLYNEKPPEQIDGYTFTFVKDLSKLFQSQFDAASKNGSVNSMLSHWIASYGRDAAFAQLTKRIGHGTTRMHEDTTGKVVKLDNRVKPQFETLVYKFRTSDDGAPVFRYASLPTAVKPKEKRKAKPSDDKDQPYWAKVDVPKSTEFHINPSQRDARMARPTKAQLLFSHEELDDLRRPDAGRTTPMARKAFATLAESLQRNGDERLHVAVRRQIPRLATIPHIQEIMAVLANSNVVFDPATKFYRMAENPRQASYSEEQRLYIKRKKGWRASMVRSIANELILQSTKNPISLRSDANAYKSYQSVNYLRTWFQRLQKYTDSHDIAGVMDMANMFGVDKIAYTARFNDRSSMKDLVSEGRVLMDSASATKEYKRFKTKSKGGRRGARQSQIASSHGEISEGDDLGALEDWEKKGIVQQMLLRQRLTRDIQKCRQDKSNTLSTNQIIYRLTGVRRFALTRMSYLEYSLRFTRRPRYSHYEMLPVPEKSPKEFSHGRLPPQKSPKETQLGSSHGSITESDDHRSRAVALLVFASALVAVAYSLVVMDENRACARARQSDLASSHGEITEGDDVGGHAPGHRGGRGRGGRGGGRGGGKKKIDAEAAATAAQGIADAVQDAKAAMDAAKDMAVANDKPPEPTPGEKRVNGIDDDIRVNRIVESHQYCLFVTKDGIPFSSEDLPFQLRHAFEHDFPDLMVEFRTKTEEERVLEPLLRKQRHMAQDYDMRLRANTTRINELQWFNPLNIMHRLRRNHHVEKLKNLEMPRLFMVDLDVPHVPEGCQFVKISIRNAIDPEDEHDIRIPHERSAKLMGGAMSAVIRVDTWDYDVRRHRFHNHLSSNDRIQFDCLKGSYIPLRLVSDSVVSSLNSFDRARRVYNNEPPLTQNAARWYYVARWAKDNHTHSLRNMHLN